jgi:predicted peptidase
MTRSLLVLALCLFSLPSLSLGQASAFLFGKQTAKDGLVLPYRLFIPKNYNPQKSYPLVFALHGAGERGTDDTLQLTTHRLATLWALDSNQAKHPSFILAPQCPPFPAVWVNTPFGGGSYDQSKVPFAPPLRAALEILDSMLIKYSIDTNRIYVAGLSMGGYATWDILMRFPKRFAAAIPICGGADTSKAPSIKHLPIWAFHGDSDKTVPVASTRQMIAALKKAGGTPLYTEYPKVDHGSWGPALREPQLADWLFAQARASSTAMAGPRAPRPPALADRKARFIFSGTRSGSGIGEDLSAVDGLGRAAPSLPDR